MIQLNEMNSVVSLWQYSGCSFLYFALYWVLVVLMVIESTVLPYALYSIYTRSNNSFAHDISI